MDASNPPPEPVEITIHDLARSYDALVETVQQLLYGHSRTDAHFLALPMEKSGSLYSLMNQRVKLGRLSPAKIVPILSLVLRELDRHHAFLANLTSQRSRLVLRRSDFDLGELLSEVVELFEGPAVKKGIDLRLNVQAKNVHERPLVYADKQQVYRLFMNVIDNAVKYSYSSTDQSFRHVDIVCRRHTTEGHWLTTIESYGVGILPEEQGRVFEYGKRGELARDRDRHGSGIGLSEAKRIASLHGGSVELESRPAVDSSEKDGISRSEHPYVTIVKVVLPSR
jgi:signal transduction histidine kinase